MPDNKLEWPPSLEPELFEGPALVLFTGAARYLRVNVKPAGNV